MESKFNLLTGPYHLICQNEILCEPSLEYLEAELLGYADNSWRTNLLKIIFIGWTDRKSVV